jgi:hypothetical protein
MQQFLTFSHNSPLTLQDALNLWLKTNKNTVKVKNISYAIDVQQSLYSALVFFVSVPDVSNLFIHR